MSSPLLLQIQSRQPSECLPFALAYSPQPKSGPLLHALVRCRTLHEVETIAAALRLNVRASADCLELRDQGNSLQARAWLF